MKHIMPIAAILTLLTCPADNHAGAPYAVFIGDSITANWNLDAAFPGVNVVNAGVGGQTSTQILARFDADVIARHPQVVVIEAGTNDLYYDQLPQSVTEANITEMVTMARANGIQPILASTVPVSPAWYATRDPQRVTALNDWLRSFATDQGVPFLDYYSALDGPAHDTLTVDGLHPNAAGYERMISVVDVTL